MLGATTGALDCDTWKDGCRFGWCEPHSIVERLLPQSAACAAALQEYWAIRDDSDALEAMERCVVARLAVEAEVRFGSAGSRLHGLLQTSLWSLTLELSGGGAARLERVVRHPEAWLLQARKN